MSKEKKIPAYLNNSKKIHWRLDYQFLVGLYYALKSRQWIHCDLKDFLVHFTFSTEHIHRRIDWCSEGVYLAFLFHFLRLGKVIDDEPNFWVFVRDHFILNYGEEINTRSFSTLCCNDASDIVTNKLKNIFDESKIPPANFPLELSN